MDIVSRLFANGSGECCHKMPVFQRFEHMKICNVLESLNVYHVVRLFPGSRVITLAGTKGRCTCVLSMLEN